MLVIFQGNAINSGTTELPTVLMCILYQRNVHNSIVQENQTFWNVITLFFNRKMPYPDTRTCEVGEWNVRCFSSWVLSTKAAPHLSQMFLLGLSGCASSMWERSAPICGYEHSQCEQRRIESSPSPLSVSKIGKKNQIDTLDMKCINYFSHLSLEQSRFCWIFKGNYCNNRNWEKWKRIFIKG